MHGILEARSRLGRGMFAPVEEGQRGVLKRVVGGATGVCRVFGDREGGLGNRFPDPRPGKGKELSLAAQAKF